MKHNSILIIRHAIKAHPGFNVGLGEQGIQQAKQIAKAIRCWHTERIISSPLLRAVETAAIIGIMTSINVEVNDNFEERRVGRRIPIGSKLFLEEWAKTENYRDYLPIGGESSRMAGDRFTAALIGIIKNKERKRTIVVSHGGIIVDFLLNTKLITSQIIDKEKAIPHGSITEISFSRNKWRLIRLGKDDLD